MSKILLKNIASITMAVQEKTAKTFDSIRWVTPANLLPNNMLAGYEYGLSFKPSIPLLVKNGDIIVRRILPSYVNYIYDIAPNAYIANNLILIRAKNSINSRYLAYYLNRNIEKIIRKAAKGTTLPTLARQDLSEFEIIVPDERVQYLIGKLWYLEVEKKKLQEELKNLESKKLFYILNKCTQKTEEFTQ